MKIRLTPSSYYEALGFSGIPSRLSLYAETEKDKRDLAELVRRYEVAGCGKIGGDYSHVDLVLTEKGET